MCGIIAHVGSEDAVETLLTGLENLEYRGYDSAGLAVENGDGLDVHKESGRVSDLRETVNSHDPEGQVGIGHTRWSTHGPPTDENAHPHTNGESDIAVVHNGVIKNYSELRDSLEERGYTFTSDTDTEVVPHLFDYYLNQGLNPEASFRRAMRTVEGSYAIAAVVSGDDAVYAAREGSPLVLGLDDDDYYLASDVPAFLEETDEVAYLEDGDMVVVRPDGVSMSTIEGEPVTRGVETVDWDPEETGKGEYDHFMLKEIHSQPTAIQNTIQSRVDAESGSVRLEGVPQAFLDDVDHVQFVACGTSYHAGLIGAHLLKQAGLRAEAIRASEYVKTTGPVSEDTLVVAVTQSGETADTLNAMTSAAAAGAQTLTVTNVVGSSAARKADEAVFIRAGPEIGVAATKTFTSQVATLSILAEYVADSHSDAELTAPTDEFVSELVTLTDGIEEIIESGAAEAAAEKYLDSESYFFIGQGLGYSVAKEGALKFKEITYEHAEGFTSGELKHGPLALVTGETPVVAVFTGEDENTLTNATEAQARRADIVAVAPEGHPATDIADTHLPIPETNEVCAALLANVQLQLLAYHAAKKRDRAIDKPRNLAKSVTVE